MLTVNNLTKRYGDVLANSKVTFTRRMDRSP